MKASIIICTYNRPEYLAQCFQSLRRADMIQGTVIVIVDDASHDIKTVQLINEFDLTGCKVIKITKQRNAGIKDSLLIGYSIAFNHGDIVINLDGDAVVRKDFLTVLCGLKKTFPHNIVSGFNTTVENRNPIISEHKTFFKKKYASGINMVINKFEYLRYIEPALKGAGNWDYQASLLHENDGNAVIVSNPSVIQHIGIVSSMGHAVTEKPDVATDWWMFELPTVTLIGVSCNDLDGLIKAADISSRYIKFGAVGLLSSQKSNDPRVIHLTEPITSRAEYNKFILKRLHEYIITDHVLIIQPDGYVVKAYAWENEFLKYDYIGASWQWYNDSMQVGNGGFSLRSRKLHDILGKDNFIQPVNDHLIKNFEEDHNICRIYRRYLEHEYGIKFAPVEIANRFSIEAYGVSPPHNKYNGSFGFHGYGSIDWSEAKLEHIPTKQ